MTKRTYISVVFILLLFLLTWVKAQEKTTSGDQGTGISAIVLINKKISNISFTSISGEKKTLEELKGTNATIVAFLNFHCPISNKIIPELIELGNQYKEKKVNVIGVCCDLESPKELDIHIQDFKINFPTYYDPEHIVSSAFYADVTPQFFLIDSGMTLRYAGRMNDQYFDRTTPNLVVKNQDLKVALENVLANKEVNLKITQPIGCPLDRVKKPVLENGKVTFYKDVLPILQKNCQVCHRKGEVGPFPLMTFKDAYNWAELISDQVTSGVMPPWKPSEKSIPLKNDPRLTKEEIETIKNWVDEGCPKGNEKDAPPPMKFKPSQSWDGGRQPDIILESPGDFHLGPIGDDHYRTIVMPLNNKEEIYVDRIQFIPGNPKIVHHALYFYDSNGILLDAQKRLGNPTPPPSGVGDWGPGYNSGMGLGFIPNPAQLTKNKDNPGSSLGGWVPAVDSLATPPETAYVIPPQSSIFMQIHYHRNGKHEVDRSKLGLWLTKKPPTKYIKGYLVDTNFTIIPPGIKSYKSTGTRVIQEDLKIFTIAPHAHMIADQCRLYYTLPNSKEKVLFFEIKNWDFNWQQRYYPKKYLELPKGTTLHIEWIFDNTIGNPQNPYHPPKPIFLGENTTDEMGFCIIGGIINEKNHNAPTDLLNYFEKLLKAEALKTLLTGNK